MRATIVDAVKSKLSNEYKLKKSGQKDFMTPLEYVLILRSNLGLANHFARREAHSDNTRTPRVLINHTKNTRLADGLDDEERYLNVAKLLKGVKPENAHTTTEIIVSMATAFFEVGDLAVIEKKEEDRMVGRRSRCRRCGSITKEVFDSTTVSLWQRTQNTLDRTTKP